VRGLAQMLGISVITTRRAYTELEQQGYVLTIPAKGTFVSYGYRDRLKELGMLKLDEMLSNVAHLAKALQIDEAELAAMLSNHCAYVQEHEYNPLKARQILTQFIRNR
ncbi:MAG: GntR family transcriptional regulator, partial [Peptococcaceae bacterium]|nr:GntR family transcriptional regulator [Peptococcaceae bacterium]